VDDDKREKADFDRHVQLEEQLLELAGDDVDKLREIIFELMQKVGIEELEQILELLTPPTDPNDASGPTSPIDPNAKSGAI
jgi:hypothetical protein